MKPDLYLLLYSQTLNKSLEVIGNQLLPLSTAALLRRNWSNCPNTPKKVSKYLTNSTFVHAIALNVLLIPAITITKILTCNLQLLKVATCTSSLAAGKRADGSMWRLTQLNTLSSRTRTGSTRTGSVRISATKWWRSGLPLASPLTTTTTASCARATRLSSKGRLKVKLEVQLTRSQRRRWLAQTSTAECSGPEVTTRERHSTRRGMAWSHGQKSFSVTEPHTSDSAELLRNDFKT